MHVSLLFDVEDPLTTESDDMTKWVADELSVRNLSGTFLLTGDKARRFDELGRDDVIDSLGDHDIGYHSNYHSIHPTISEYLAETGWFDGIDRVYDVEGQGYLDLCRIFNRPPSCFGCPGGSFGPHIPAFAGGLDITTVYTPFMCEDQNVYWFAGSLNLSNLFGGLDLVYHDQNAFEDKFEALNSFIDEQQDRTSWIGVFCGHPTRMCAEEYWDGPNLSKGRNPPREEWVEPQLKSESSMKVVKHNIKRLFDYLATNDDIEVLSVREASEYYEPDEHAISKERVVEIATKAVEQSTIQVGTEMTAAQTLVSFARIVVGMDVQNVPDRISLRPIYGPVTPPVGLQQPIEVSYDMLVEAAKSLIDHTRQQHSLPASIEVNQVDVDIGALYHAFANIVAQEWTDTTDPCIVEPVVPYPNIGENIRPKLQQKIMGWPIHDPHLNPENLIDHLECQTWTLKQV